MAHRRRTLSLAVATASDLAVLALPDARTPIGGREA